MMLQKPSSRWSAAKALLLLPLVGLSLGAFARTVYVLPEQQDKSKQKPAIIKVQNADTMQSAPKEMAVNVKVDRVADGKQSADTLGKVMVVVAGTDQAAASNAVYYVNGKKINSDQIRSISPDAINKMTVLKGQSAKDAGYDTEGKEGVVLITLKGDNAQPKGEKASVKARTATNETPSPSGADAATSSSAKSAPIIVIDGQKSDNAVLRYIDTSLISSIKVLNSREDVARWTDDKSVESVIYVTTKMAVQKSAPSEKVFDKVDEMPQFEGGDFANFLNWLNSQICYPKEALAEPKRARVIAEFVIEEDGTLSSVKIVNSVEECFSDEVKRLLRQSPKWVPGKLKGKAVRVKYTLPVEFMATDSDPAKS